MTTAFQIEPAQPSDGPAVQSCAELAFAGYIAAIGRKPAPMTADYPALIAQGQVFVAKDPQGAVLGFLCQYIKDSAMILDTVAVFPTAMGKGVGRALIQHCEVTARSNGLASVKLYTNAKMAANLDYYPKLGYQLVGRWHQDGFDRVFFEKPLGAAPK